MQLLANSELGDLVAKVEAGDRLTREDGYRLHNNADLMIIGHMADAVRRRIVGSAGFYVNAVQMNAAAPDLEAELARAREIGAREVQITGEVDCDSAIAVVRTARQALPPTAQIVAYDPLTVAKLAGGANMAVDAVLADLAAAGAAVLGAGSPTLADKAVCLQVQRAAHALGLKSHAALAHTGAEPFGEVIDFLVDLRELQEQTGGVLSFQSLPQGRTTGSGDLRLIAVSRMMLENVPHIKVSGTALGMMKTAQFALAYGADDLDAIIHEVNPLSPQESGAKGMIYLINQTGRDAIERDAFGQTVTLTACP